MTRSGMARGVAVALTLGISFTAADGAYRWEQHLHGSEVRSLAATEDALWCATLAGLVRFDLADSSLTVFRQSSRGLPSDSLNAVAVDANGDVWCGTASAAAAIRGSRGGWEFFRTFDGIPHPSVLTLAARGSTMFVGTGMGFAVLEGRDVVDACTIIDPCVTRLPDLQIQAALPLDGETWIGTARGIGRLVGTEADSSSNALLDTSILTLAEHDDRIWCGTPEGPYRKDASGNGWTLTNEVEGAGPIGARVPALISTKEGLFAAVTGGPHRVYRWDDTIERWRVDTNGNFDSRRTPLCFTVDATGQLWCGTSAGLLARVDGRWTSEPIGVPGLTDPRTLWSIDAADGEAWVGHEAAVAQHYDGVSWTEIPASASTLEPTNVQAVYRDHRGRVWFGHCCCSDVETCLVDRLVTGPGGDEWVRVPAHNTRAIVSDGGSLVFFGAGAEDPTAQAFGLSIWHESFPPDSLFRIRDDTKGFELSSNRVTGLAFDDAGRLWIATRGNGLDVWDYGSDPFDPSDDEWERRVQFGDDLISNAVLDIAAFQNQIWVATFAGVTLFENGVSRGSFGRTFFANPLVRSIDVASDGSAWAATPAGVTRFLPNALGDFDVESYRFPELSNDEVAGLATDGRTVWVASQRGVSVGTPAPDEGETIRADRLGGAYPNPFRPRDHDGLRLVDVDVPVDGAVFDASGGLVARFDDVPPDGIVWDGRIAGEGGGTGLLAVPGLYVIIARSGDFRVTARVAVIR